MIKEPDMKDEKQTIKKLQTSELRYRRLFEAAQDGILILDADTGMIEDVNPFLIKILGYSREEFLKKRYGKWVRLEIFKPPPSGGGTNSPVDGCSRGICVVG